MRIETTSVSASMPIQSVVDAQQQTRNQAVDAVKSRSAVDPKVQSIQLANNEKTAEESREQVSEAVKKINDVIQVVDRNLEFTVDKDTDMTVVKVIDSESKEVIRQIPSEEVVQIAKALDKLQGLLLRDKA